MKLPISIFPNVTEYTKANWTGYLEPRDITLTNHTNLGSGVTWEMLDKGTIHIHKPKNADLTNALMEWKVKCPDNTKVILMAEHNTQLTDFKPHPTGEDVPFRGIDATRVSTANEKSIVYVSDTNGWTLTGLTFGWAFAPHTNDIYISLVNGDRLDACLSGNHLKSISAGDKLGLVYWDGTTFSADSTYAVFVKNNPDWDCVYLYKGWGGLGVRKISTNTNKILIPNGSTGTVNLNDYGFTITGIANGTGTNPLGKHLMHVI